MDPTMGGKRKEDQEIISKKVRVLMVFLTEHIKFILLLTLVCCYVAKNSNTFVQKIATHCEQPCNQEYQT
jgi:hypothetical protein